MRAFARPLSLSWDQAFHWHTEALPLPGAGHVRAKSASLMAWRSRKRVMRQKNVPGCMCLAPKNVIVAFALLQETIILGHLPINNIF